MIKGEGRGADTTKTPRPVDENETVATKYEKDIGGGGEEEEGGGGEEEEKERGGEEATGGKR